MIPISFFLFVLLFFRGVYAQVRIPTQESVKLAGIVYPLKPVDSEDQGQSSKAYTITRPFEGRHAVLKVVIEDDNTHLEVDYLNRMHQLLYAERASTPFAGLFYIVIENLEKKNPPYKPFYKWYLEDRQMNAEESLFKMRQAVGNQLYTIAVKDELLYWDFHMRNIFIDKDIRLAAPIDWAPSVHATEQAGVFDISGLRDQPEKYQAKLNKYRAALKENVKKAFSITVLAEELKLRNETLRT